MKAVIRDTYGPPDVLRLEEVERPSPGPDELLVRVRASSLNRADCYIMQGVPMPLRLATGLFGPRKPGLGMDFAGDVVERGSAVTETAQAVYGQVDMGQTWAEYACVPAAVIAPMPANVDYEQAAAVPLSGLTALQGLRDKAQVAPGQTVLINGGSGAVGTFAIQIARALGAEVTAVCGQRNLTQARELGAEHVIAYETEDYTECGRRFDAVFDIVMNRSPGANRRIMKRSATYVPAGAPEGRWFGPVIPLLAALLQSPFVSQRVRSFVGTPNRADMLALTELIEAGDVTPAIDRTFPLDDIQDAMRYLIDGRPGAKVVLSIP